MTGTSSGNHGSDTLVPDQDANEPRPPTSMSHTAENDPVVEGQQHLALQPRTRPLRLPSCRCNHIGVSGAYDTQPSRMGVFTRQSNSINGRWVYMNADGKFLYYPSGYGWRISSDYASTASNVRDLIYSNALCPEDVGSDFKAWDGENWGGSVAVVCRVPAPPGCDSFALTGAESTNPAQMGSYEQYTRTPDGRWVYKNYNNQMRDELTRPLRVVGAGAYELAAWGDPSRRQPDHHHLRPGSPRLPWLGVGAGLPQRPVYSCASRVRR